MRAGIVERLVAQNASGHGLIANRLLAAVRFKDTLLIALIGASTTAIAHVVSHVVDSDKGGNPTDIPLLAVFAAILAAGTAVRIREVKA
jgi:hypothetical protein